MKTNRVLFASSLKPVDDIRMFHKLGMSLDTNKYELHFFGYPSTTKSTNQNNNIHFHPWQKFKRIGIYRLLLPWFLLIKIIKLKPKVLVINSTEFLLLIFLYRIILGDKIIYDIQENYFLNIIHQKVYPPVIKHLLPYFIRFWERISSICIKHFVLAEKCYVEQLNFIGNKFTILENKHLKTNQQSVFIKNPKINFIISGTISEEFGVLNGLQFFEHHQKLLPDCTITIIGKCSNKAIYNTLKEYQIKKPGIKLKISLSPIPFLQIEEAIRMANYGLVLYQKSKAFDGKIPTKVYEYMSHKLPIITFEDLSFCELIKENHAGTFVTRDFKNVQDMFTKLHQQAFYDCKPSIDPNWNIEKVLFQKIIDDLT